MSAYLPKINSSVGRVRLVVVAAALACAGYVHAQSAPGAQAREEAAEDGFNSPMELSIREATLGAALEAWAQQTGIEITYASADVAARAPAGEVRGTMTARQALQRLLPPDVLFRLVDANTVMVGNRAAMQKAEAGGASAARGAGAAGGADGDSAASGAQRVEIVGTHLNSDAAPPATKVIDAEQIARAGYSSIEDVFRHLTQSGGGVTSAGVALGEQEYGEKSPPQSTIGASSINLRGLGSRATLILVDGRRIANSAQGAGLYTDISSIPIAQVERIEVLTDGASAIYGADAVGGVVNIVLKKDYEGTQVQLRLEKSNTGADQQRLSIARAFTWDGGKLVAAGQLQRSLPTDLTSHIHVGPTGRGDFTDLGGINNRLTGIGDRGVVFSAGLFRPEGGGEKVWASKDVLGQVPVGQTGPLSPSDLQPLDPNNLPSYFRPLNIGPKDTSGNVRLDATQQLGGGHELSGGLSFARQANTAPWRPDLSSFYILSSFKAVPNPNRPGHYLAGFDISRQLALVSPDNPYNPFGKPVMVGYTFAKEFSSFNLTNEERQTNLNGYVGVHGPTPWAGWTYDTSINRSQESSNSLAYSTQAFMGAPGSEGTLAKEVLDSLNLFTDGSDPAVIASNVKALKRLLETSRVVGNSHTTQLETLLRGPLFQMDAGPAQAALGVQFRNEGITRTTEGIPVDAVAKRRVGALFGELGVPLVKDAPMAKHLGIAVAARYEHLKQNGISSLINEAVGYDAKWNEVDVMKLGGFDQPTVFGIPYVPPGDGSPGSGSGAPFALSSTFSNISPSLRFNWEPVDSLVLRATVGRSFLTPAASQLYGFVDLTEISGYWGPTDPPLPPGVDYVAAMSGANFTLKPQVANTQTLGFDWTPLRGDEGILRLSMTYNHTRFDNYIGDPGADIGTQRYLAELVKSATPPAINNGVMLVDMRDINFARRESSTLDFSVMYATDTPIGDVNVDFNASRTISLLSQPLASMPVFQFGNTEFGPPRWKANMITSLITGDYTTTLGFNYTSPHRVIDPASNFGINKNPNPRTTAASYTTVDLQLAYAPQSGSLEGWKFTVGAQNIFDKAYPFVDNFNGFLSERVATRGRVFYLDVTAKF